jgi:hypothetical protein
LCRCLASLAQKWEVLWVEGDGDRRSYAILTQNFPMESGEIGKKKKKPKKPQAVDATEALRSPDSGSLTLFCRSMEQLYLGGKMPVKTNDLPPKEATQ